MPVSYTHLDVYKRQVLGSGSLYAGMLFHLLYNGLSLVLSGGGQTGQTLLAQIGGLQGVWTLLARTGLYGMVPVSYTHLDVYKRQATTLIVRIVNGSALRALTSFYSAMNEYAGVVSVDPMTQIAIYQQEQTALISRMAENLSSDLVDKMGKGIAMSIGKSYQGLQNLSLIHI